MDKMMQDVDVFDYKCVSTAAVWDQLRKESFQNFSGRYWIFDKKNELHQNFNMTGNNW